MTREEELDWLYRLRSKIYVYMPKEWLIPMNNALDMAIKELEQESTTKNNLEVENDLVSSIVEKISEKVTETREEFIFETIRPYCEDVVQMKISKRDLEQALLKYYCKNNLGVDCVARQDVERFIEGFINEYTPEEELEFINLELDGLKHIPPVTPQEPKTGHWIDTNNHQYYNDGYIETTELRCSCCNEEVEWDIELPHKPYFCENCGADMKEAEE